MSVEKLPISKREIDDGQPHGMGSTLKQGLGQGEWRDFYDVGNSYKSIFTAI